MSETLGHRLRVSAVIDETPDARSLILDVPEELRDRFTYRPGQFLTLRVPAQGGAVGRCYSLSSAPEVDPAPKVTVKRVAGGVGSNWLCDQVKAGDLVEVLPPAGVFTSPDLAADHLLIAGGSGITPVMSLLKAVLARPTGRVVLIYANRGEESVIFAGELRELTERHPERLLVIHLLESVQGLPSTAQLVQLVRPFATFPGAFICGPAPFMDAAERAALACGLKVTIERFRSLEGDPFLAAPVSVDEDEAAATLTVTLNGERTSLPWPSQTTLVDLLKSRGLDPPYSCREGACSACSCKIVTGEVKLLRNDVLEEEDLAEGWALGCQAVPVTDTVEITYDMY
ncbi:2Fe-2S iron-sulfur cluster-binding protein [Nonomuraea bangladeshensis]